MKELLEVLSRQDAKSKVTVTGRINNSTRKGCYMKIARGLAFSVWFVGRGETGDLIAERVA